MKILTRHKKRIIAYAALLLLFIFFISPIFSLFYLFNENKSRQEILSQFNNKDYNIEINGHITPELWHGLSIKIRSISIASHNDHQLIHVGNMICQFSWLDAVFGNYRLRRVSINDVDFYEKDALNYGIKNLLNSKTFTLSALKEMNYFEINDIHSVGTNIPYHFDDGTLKIFLEDAIPEFKFSMNLLDKNLYFNASGSLDSVKSDLIQFAQFNTSLYNESFNANTTGSATYDLANNILKLKIADGETSFMGYQGKISTDDLTISNTGLNAVNTNLSLNISRDLLHQEISLNFDNLTSTNFQSLYASHATLKYNNSFENNSINIASNLNDINIESSGSILTKSCSNTLALKAPDIIKSQLQINTTGNCDYFAQNKLFNFKLNGMINNSPLQVNLQVLNAKKPQVILSGNIMTLNLSNVDQSKILPLYYDQSTLPLSWLSFITMNANLNIAKLTLDQINLTNVVTDFDIHNNKLNVNNFKANLYGGNLVSTGSILKNNNSNYDIRTKQKFTNLDIKSMFKNIFDVSAINGKADITTDIKANGISNYEELHKKLNGHVNITATNGAFQGIDFNLFSSPKTLSLTTIKNTPFKELKADFNFVNGISSNSSINFSSPYLITAGSGIINFKNTTLDYNLTIKSQLPNNNEKIKAVVIPVGVSGDLFNPKVNIEKIYLSNKKSIVTTKHGHHVHYKHKN